MLGVEDFNSPRLRSTLCDNAGRPPTPFRTSPRSSVLQGNDWSSRLGEIRWSRIRWWGRGDYSTLELPAKKENSERKTRRSASRWKRREGTFTHLLLITEIVVIYNLVRPLSNERRKRSTIFPVRSRSLGVKRRGTRRRGGEMSARLRFECMTVKSPPTHVA